MNRRRTFFSSLDASDWILVFVAAIPYLVLVFYFNFICDDSLISFRYARNLVEGFGLRYNPGESLPVEGFSNLLWVLIIALFNKLGADPLISSRVISIGCGLLLLAVVYCTCRNLLGQNRLRAFIGSLTLGLFPPFAVWSTGGLETGLFTLSLFGLMVLILNAGDLFPVFRSALIGLAIMLLRPEGMGYAFLIPLLAGIYFHLSGKSGTWRRGLLLYFLICVLGLVILTLWRLYYFDSYLPNTFFAKVGSNMNQFVRGGNYVAHFLLTFIGVVPIAGAAVFGIIGRGRRLETAPFLAASLAIIILPLPLGGDFMAMARFMVPAAPYLAVLAACMLRSKRADLKRPNRGPFILIALLAIMFNLLPAFNMHVTPVSWRKPFNFRWNLRRYQPEKIYWKIMIRNTRRWTRVGKLLAGITSPEQSIVTGAIGAIGYYSDLHIYDLYGLVNREVARMESTRKKRSAGHDKKASRFFFLDYEPDIIKAKILGEDSVPSREMALSSYLNSFPKTWRSKYFIYSRKVGEDRQGKGLVFLAIMHERNRAAKGRLK